MRVRGLCLPSEVGTPEGTSTSTPSHTKMRTASHVTACSSSFAKEHISLGRGTAGTLWTTFKVQHRRSHVSSTRKVPGTFPARPPSAENELGVMRFNNDNPSMAFGGWPALRVRSARRTPFTFAVRTPDNSQRRSGGGRRHRRRRPRPLDPRSRQCSPCPGLRRVRTVTPVRVHVTRYRGRPPRTAPDGRRRGRATCPARRRAGCRPPRLASTGRARRTRS